MTTGDPFIGRVLNGAYRVDDRIGEGGFGAVYSAVQLAVDRPVAIKVLRPDKLADDPRTEEMLVKRFQREALATSRLMHPNTVRLIDFGEAEDGVLYLALELLVGQDLQAVIEEQAPLSPERVATLGRQVCLSLSEAHSQGIVHRDLKPSNVFLCSYEGAPDFVKVMDFGIARVVASGAGDSQLTRTGMVTGTPKYMAPEQAMAKAVGPTADLYSVGCILYEALTGGPVFDRDSAMAIGLAHVQEPPPPVELPGAPPEVEAAWDAFIGWMLEKDPEDRPGSASEAAERLRELEEISRGAAPAAASGASADDPSVTQAPTLAAGEAVQGPAALQAPLRSRVDSMDADPLETLGADLAGIRRPRYVLPALVALAAGGVGFGLWWLSGEKPSGAGGDTDRIEAREQVTSEESPGASEAATRTGEVAEVTPDAEGPTAEEPALPLARLTVTTTPPGARLHRGEDEGAPVLCTTPCREVEVEPDEESEAVLVLRREGYRAARIPVSLAPGLLFRTDVRLEALPRPDREPSAKEAEEAEPERPQRRRAKKPTTRRKATKTRKDSAPEEVAPAEDPPRTEPSAPEEAEPPAPATKEPPRRLPGFRDDEVERPDGPPERPNRPKRLPGLRMN